jgi:hypothetical protein
LTGGEFKLLLLDWRRVRTPVIIIIINSTTTTIIVISIISLLLGNVCFQPKIIKSKTGGKNKEKGTKRVFAESIYIQQEIT